MITALLTLAVLFIALGAGPIFVFERICEAIDRLQIRRDERRMNRR